MFPHQFLQLVTTNKLNMIIFNTNHLVRKNLRTENFIWILQV